MNTSFKVKIAKNKNPHSYEDFYNLAGAEGFEPSEYQSQNLVPYRLAMPQYKTKMAGPAGFEPAG